MKHLDAIGFGALNVDNLFKVSQLSPAENENIIIDNIESCGGSAANTIVGLARLKCKTGFIGKIGNDQEGEMLLSDFVEEKVDDKGIIRTSEGKSGKALGLTDLNGHRALYVDSGVNDTIKLHEIDMKYAFDTQFLHLTSFVGEQSFQTQIDLVKSIPEDVKVTLDPGMLYARKGLSKLDSLIKRCYVFLPNSQELELLTGKSDYCHGAAHILQRGVRIVAVKLGERGCYVSDGRSSDLVKPFKVEPVDTTGAGDAFNAGFIYGLLKGKDLEQCGRIGNFSASRCIMKMGARTCLPFLDDLKFLGKELN